MRKTGRVVVTDERHENAWAASRLAAIVVAECFASLRAPIRRVAVPPVPVPYAESLERALVSSAERIAAGA